MSKMKKRQQAFRNAMFENMKIGMKKEATDVAILVMSYMSIMYLRDKEGYGKTRLTRYMDYITTMLKDIDNNLLDFKDMIEVIEEETGFKMELPERRFI